MASFECTRYVIRDADSDCCRLSSPVLATMVDICIHVVINNNAPRQRRNSAPENGPALRDGGGDGVNQPYGLRGTFCTSSSGISPLPERKRCASHLICNDTYTVDHLGAALPRVSLIPSSPTTPRNAPTLLLAAQQNVDCTGWPSPSWEDRGHHGRIQWNRSQYGL